MRWYRWQVYIDTKGRSPGHAYQLLRRKLLALGGRWSDTDFALVADPAEDESACVDEEEIQAARRQWNKTEGITRLCMDPECDHGIVIDHLPVCMMTEQELEKLPNRLKRMMARMQNRLQKIGDGGKKP